jgi:hypothetical protein
MGDKDFLPASHKKVLIRKLYIPFEWPSGMDWFFETKGKAKAVFALVARR